MHFEISEDAKKWAHSKGGQLTVELLEVKGCCAPDVQEIVVLPRKPKNAAHYQEVQIDHLSIYVHKSLLLNEKLIFRLKGFGIFKTIEAKAQ